MSHLTIFIAFVLFFAQAANAFWIFDHTPLVQDRIDPIETPGGVGQHVHTVIGASNFRPALDGKMLESSECSTAPVQADMSNYWAPQLYHRDGTNNSYTLIPLVSVKTYYLQRLGPNTSNLTAFPPNLRMIAGLQNRTAFNESSVPDKAVSFVCLDPASDAGPHPLMPDHGCQYGLRAQVNFPSCWDGQNTDSEDHMSHMAYPIGAPDFGDCPASHPHKTVLLFTEWVFDVGKFPFVSGQKNWVFANGDDEGLGFHADFVNGWQQDVLEAAVSTCTADLFGNVEACPPFAPHINRTRAETCAGTSYVEEEIRGPLGSLPGCNPSPAQHDAVCPGLATPALKGYVGPSGTVSASGTVAATSTPTAPPSSGMSTTDAATPTSALALSLSSMLVSLSSAIASLSAEAASASSALAAHTTIMSVSATASPAQTTGSEQTMSTTSSATSSSMAPTPSVGVYKRGVDHHRGRRGGH